MKALKLTIAFAAAIFCLASCAPKQETATSAIDTLTLDQYDPVSVFNVPVHIPMHAKFNVIDMHSHAFRDNVEQIKEWAKILDDNHVDRVVINTYAHGDEFERLYDLYKGVSDKFEMWCGFNYDDFGTPEFAATAIADLERCVAKGAKGVGELGDKGFGESYCTRPKATAHINDPCFDPILEKCGELGLPINFHAGDPIWMYLPIDEHNDGLTNAGKWAIDPNQPGILGLEEVVETVIEAVAKHPNTIFIGAHFLNISHEYDKLAAYLDQYPNLYVDNSARHYETCVTPRATKAFYEKYQDRIIFGTDDYARQEMYSLVWRILETEDEHFYAMKGESLTGSYHWPLFGLGLSDEVLQKIYHDNAVKVMGY